MAQYFAVIAGGMAVVLLAGMLGMMELGRRMGRRRALADPEGRTGLGEATGAIYALLGLLIAFSFSGAASRFEGRRELLVAEANAIGTAYLRIDTLAPEAQPALRELFRRYTDSRLEAYRKLPDVDAAFAELARCQAIQGELWALAVAATRGPGAPAAVVVLPPINEMFDAASSRTLLSLAHPPLAIFLMLVALALVSALMVGYGMAPNAARSVLHAVVYAAVVAAVICLIIDLEFPRLGVIRIDGIDQALVDVRRSMD